MCMPFRLTRVKTVTMENVTKAAPSQGSRKKGKF